ncbi:hypothetical protein V1477_013018, partial [Vespula maculifrons]
MRQVRRSIPVLSSASVAAATCASASIHYPPGQSATDVEVKESDGKVKDRNRKKEEEGRDGDSDGGEWKRSHVIPVGRRVAAAVKEDEEDEEGREEKGEDEDEDEEEEEEEEKKTKKNQRPECVSSVVCASSTSHAEPRAKPNDSSHPTVSSLVPATKQQVAQPFPPAPLVYRPPY